MPAGTIQLHHRVGAGRHACTDLGQMQVHGLGVDIWQHQSGTDTMGRTDGAENVGPFVTSVAGCRRAAALVGPEIGQAALLADPRFVLEPKFDRLFARGLGGEGGPPLRKVFLKVCMASISCAGCCGRADSRQKPRLRSRVPTERTPRGTPNRAWMTRTRSIRRHRTTPCSAGSGPCRTISATACFCSAD